MVRRIRHKLAIVKRKIRNNSVIRYFFLTLLLFELLVTLMYQDKVNRKIVVIEKAFSEKIYCPPPCKLDLEFLVPEIGMLKLHTGILLFLIFIWWWAYAWPSTDVLIQHFLSSLSDNPKQGKRVRTTRPRKRASRGL